jgi:serine/threonine protein kinase
VSEQLPPTRTLNGDAGAEVAPKASAPSTVDVGDRIGRYVIDAHLGAGGMGAVYRGTDEVLHRPVALKLLHSDALARDPEMARRMVREARIAAKLSHANVVSVYEVGSHVSGPFIAMEYIEGVTLGEWLESGERSWRDIVSVFAEAGRGIAAAHDAGVIHRDIKPSNILVSDDRVVVADFGIAQLSLSELIPVDPATSGEIRAASMRTETIMGTPAYVAPEQAAGEPSDERSDIYSFCVALFESLYGERPGRAGAGSVAAPADNPRGVPAWVNRVLTRGLATKPSNRYSSLQPLLAALSRDPARTRRRVAAAGVGAAAFAVVGAFAVVALGQNSGESGVACEGMERHFEGVWDQATHVEVRAAFEATKKPYWQTIADSVSGELESFRADWVAKREEVCQATHIHGDQSDELLELRMRCLDRRLRAVGAVVERLRGADGRTLDRAMNALDRTTSIECDDAEALRAEFPLPEDAEARERIAQMYDQLARADALHLTADYKAAKAQIAEMEEPVAKVAHLPLEAAWLMSSAQVQLATADYDASSASFRRLTKLASRGRDDRLVARAWMSLMFSVGRAGTWSDALALRDPAAAAVARAGEPLDLRAQLANQLGVVYGRLGREREAREQLELSVELTERALEPNSLRLASPMNNLAAAYMRAGEFAPAEELLRRVVAIRVRAYGETHPALGSVYTNLGLSLNRQGRYDDGAEVLERVLGMYTASLPPGHRRLGDIRLNLAVTALNRSDIEMARGHIDAALEIYTATLPPGADLVAKAKQVSGAISVAAGDAEAGNTICTEARDALVANKTRSEFLVAALVCMGDAQLASGNHAEALERLLEARALETELGVSQRVASHTRAMVARTLWALGRAPEALVEARLALESMTGPKADELAARIAEWSAQPQ